MFPTISPKQSFPALESEVLAYWQANNTFQKSIDSRPEDNPYRFYDGPPFITGMPHYGHLLGSSVKDAVGRYWTMRGRRVDRVWGWDCHGLPIEERVQKKLGLKSNKDIEERGVKEFIDECYKYTSEVSSEWNWYIDKIGRWVDMDNAYKTMDQDYMESVMWVFSELWKKGLIYEGKRVSLYSWKLSTPISNFEVAMDDTYQDVNDPAIMVKFRLEANDRFPVGTSILAWTTTPWTIPANMALAVGKEIEYVLVENSGEQYIIAKKRLESVMKGKGEYTIIREFKGSELVGLSYLPPFPEYYHGKRGDKAHKVYDADFATDTDGTGIVHIAPEFGDVDFGLAKKIGIPVTEALDNEGRYTSEIYDYEGTHYLDLENPEKGANKINVERMKENGTLFKNESITHRVPFCPRSGTPLVQKAQASWFIDIQSQKDKLIEANEQINWFPEYLKEGRFKKGIESAPDWCISRTRFWGAPMPVWTGADGEKLVVSSREEIFELNKPYGQLTKLIITRHAESQANVDKHYDDVGFSPLSENGKKQAEALMEELANAGVDIIITSPFVRAIQTAEPLAKKLGIEIITDARLRETEHGKLANAKEGIDTKNARKEFFKNHEHAFGETGENYNDIQSRMLGVVSDICEKYPGKTVFIVSHGIPTKVLSEELNHGKAPERTKNAQPRTYILDVANKTSLNLHRPYIDSIKLQSPTTGQELTRIPEVLDVWLDSGSMPYAQMHYPFENKKEMEASFPADFIAEYVGQVRAWFYVMHVLGVLLDPLCKEGGSSKGNGDETGDFAPETTGKNPQSLHDSSFTKELGKPTPSFTNVITTGVINGNDGRKMSKSFGNYPDPRMAIEKYGADPIRFYMLNSPLLSGGDMDFKEEGIIETIKSVMLPIWNTYSFFTTYANIDNWEKDTTEVWFARHAETTANAMNKMSDGTDNPELTEKGREQAKNASKTLREQGVKFDVIIHTGLTRTVETAKIIARETAFSGEYVEDLGFLEQAAGEYANKTLQEIADMHNADVGDHPTLRTFYKNNSVENIEQFEERILTAYEEILKKYKGKNILIVGHAGTSRPIIHQYAGKTLEDAHYTTRILNADPFRLATTKIVNPLDRWILSRLQVLTAQIHDAMDAYDVSRACRSIVEYMDELTNWYVRLSRRRFWGSEMTPDKASGYETLYTVLVELSKLLAPYMPFMSESIFQGLTQRESVHLEYITRPNPHLIDNALNRDMQICEQIVSLGLGLRARKNIRVRQPLQSVTITHELSEYYQAIIRDELNIKEVRYEDPEKLAKKICKPDARKIGPKYGKDVQFIIQKAKEGDFIERENGCIVIARNEAIQNTETTGSPRSARDDGEYFILEQGEYTIEYIPLEGVGDVEGGYGMVISLDMNITETLKLEGYARDIIRAIQDMRKEADYNVTDRISLHIYGDMHREILTGFGDMIQSETLSTLAPLMIDPDLQKDIEIESDITLTIQIEK